MQSVKLCCDQSRGKCASLASTWPRSVDARHAAPDLVMGECPRCLDTSTLAARRRMQAARCGLQPRVPLLSHARAPPVSAYVQVPEQNERALGGLALLLPDHERAREPHRRRSRCHASSPWVSIDAGGASRPTSSRSRRSTTRSSPCWASHYAQDASSRRARPGDIDIIMYEVRRLPDEYLECK